MENEKPPYRVPLMAEVLATPDTGLTHVSTFSGGGGTCLGFRMAGFKTLLAMDIDELAVQTYQANLPSPILQADIRETSGPQLLARIGLAPGELDVFEGSPPCTAFSTAGKLTLGWNRSKVHAGAVQEKIEDLFFEWLRLVDELRPRSCVAENVHGLVQGVAKGYFKSILQRLKAMGYRTEARMLDAQWLGVPQRRGRVIIMGLRDDLNLAPAFPAPWPYQYSVRDVLPEIFSVPNVGARYKPSRSSARHPSPIITATPGFNGGHGTAVQVFHDTGGGPRYCFGDITRTCAPPVMAQAAGHYTVRTATTERKITINEVKRLCSFPDDYVAIGSYSEQWARFGNAVPPLMARAVALSLRDVLLSHGARS